MSPERPASAGARPRRSPGRIGFAIRSVLALLGVIAGGCGDSPKERSGHERMVELLAEIASRTADENPVLGEAVARRLREELAAVPPGAPPRESIPVLVELADREMRLGNLTEAIELLEKANRKIERVERRLGHEPEFALQARYRLGVAHLRVGETENCCLRNAPESCIVPIRGAGLHAKPVGSRAAIEQFLRVLEGSSPDDPLHLKARWLLNLAYMTVGEYPAGVPSRFLIEERLLASEEELPRFENVAPRLGLDTFDLAGGAVVDDFDGDGYLDVLVSTWDPYGQIRFFRNDRDGNFTDRTEQANLLGLLGGFNLVQADYDNDDDLDVLVLRGAWLAEQGRVPNSLLRNEGNAVFRDVTFEAGLGEVHRPTQTAAWADYDNDGYVDVYVGNEPIGQEPGEGQLFRNRGDGTFVDVAPAAGAAELPFSKSVAWGDYDDDGDADLYVSNLYLKNRLYRNEGDGTFRDVAEQAGVEGPSASFASWFWDVDNDGALDLFVAGYDWLSGNLAAFVGSQLEIPGEYELPRLYRGDGRGGFDDVASRWNLRRMSLPMGANYGDLDNDGRLDVYLGTGYPDYEALMPNVMYLNRPGQFRDVTWSGGFGHLQKGHAVVFADLDNDGDQDVFEQIGGFYHGDRFGNALFENPGFGRHWLTVKLVGTRSNRSAIGARICARVDDDETGSRSIYKTVNSGGSFGANPLRQTIGLGEATLVRELEVRWPATGETQTFHDVAVDQAIRIVEGTPGYEALALERLTLGGTRE